MNELFRLDFSRKGGIRNSRFLAVNSDTYREDIL
jgi:hypothetical protein